MNTHPIGTRRNTGAYIRRVLEAVTRHKRNPIMGDEPSLINRGRSMHDRFAETSYIVRIRAHE